MLAFDDELRKGRHILGGEALQKRAKCRNPAKDRRQGVRGRCPYAEKKEQLGGFSVMGSDRPEPSIDVAGSNVEVGRAAQESEYVRNCRFFSVGRKNLCARENRRHSSLRTGTKKDLGCCDSPARPIQDP
jgi:hypothetical protein